MYHMWQTQCHTGNLWQTQLRMSWEHAGREANLPHDVSPGKQRGSALCQWGTGHHGHPVVLQNLSFRQGIQFVVFAESASVMRFILSPIQVIIHSGLAALPKLERSPEGKIVLFISVVTTSHAQRQCDYCEFKQNEMRGYFFLLCMQPSLSESSSHHYCYPVIGKTWRKHESKNYSDISEIF